MKFRLIIPQCKDFEGGWCENSKNIESRIEVLKDSMNNNINMVITSHNYFIFFPSCLVDIRKFVENEIINHLHNRISSKERKPIIVGFDLFNDHIKFNLYGGIDAVVCFIKKTNNSNYVYGTHIWECWKCKKYCSKKCFSDQNNARVFKVGNYKIGLLSCGDIVSYCHNKGKLLPEVDIYVDLSHYSLRGDTSQYKVSKKIINEWKKADMVIVTQQVKSIKKYVNQQKYPYIFHNNRFSVNVSINKYEVFNEEGVYVDVEFHCIQGASES